ncbi:hypothetical protein RHIZ404_230467 [Rhizobium sp. EC-SD404]|nr:hypothetical protein RHIZ404_230467 [Rhizobium sp. EC-SD404]
MGATSCENVEDATVQEHFYSDEHRSGASLCSACSRSTAWLLAPMKLADRIPNSVIALEAQGPRGLFDPRSAGLS